MLEICVCSPALLGIALPEPQSQSPCDQPTEVLSAFVDGELRREEERALRRHLRTCVACQQQVRRFAALQAAVARTAVEYPLPPALRTKVRRQRLSAKKHPGKK